MSHISYITQENQNVFLKVSQNRLISDLLLDIVDESEKNFIVTPTKSSAKSHYRALLEGQTRAVGLITGENVIAPDASIIVATAESMRNIIYHKFHNIKVSGRIILVDIHYIIDEFRGGVWESIIIGLPQTMHLIMSSSLLNDINLLCKWLKFIRGRTTFVYQQVANNPQRLLLSGRNLVDARHSDVYDKCSHYFNNVSAKFAINARMVNGVRQLEAKGHKKMIFFLPSKSECERMCITVQKSKECGPIVSDFVVDKYNALIKDRSCDPIVYGSQSYNLFMCIMYRMAYYHNDVHPILREFIELLFNEGYIDIIYTTDAATLPPTICTDTIVITSLGAPASHSPGAVNRMHERCEGDNRSIVYFPLYEFENYGLYQKHIADLKALEINGSGGNEYIKNVNFLQGLQNIGLSYRKYYRKMFNTTITYASFFTTMRDHRNAAYSMKNYVSFDTQRSQDRALKLLCNIYEGDCMAIYRIIMSANEMTINQLLSVIAVSVINNRRVSVPEDFSGGTMGQLLMLVGLMHSDDQVNRNRIYIAETTYSWLTNDDQFRRNVDTNVLGFMKIWGRVVSVLEHIKVFLRYCAKLSTAGQQFPISPNVLLVGLEEVEITLRR